MSNLIARIGMILCLLYSIQGAVAQGVNFFDTDPAVFIQEFSSELNQAKHPLAGSAATGLQTIWDSGQLSEEEKTEVITQVNIMISKRFHTAPDLVNYAMILSWLKQGDQFVKIPLQDFLQTTRSCILELEKNRTAKYLRVLAEYIPEGYPIQRDKFFWHSTQPDPSLMFLTLEDKKGSYQAPVIRFTLTDLKYQSSRHNDSTLIKGTQGDFHPLSLSFVGVNGRVDWGKVGLDPEDVYCDFKDYKLNLNYGLIKVDTATLYYNSLIDGPMVGKFEDGNVGFKNLNKANYPYFKSYEGGIVIENFIPYIKYEGGFSLKGVRKIGSSYDIWVDYVPEETTFGEEGSGDSWYSDYNSDDFYSDEEKSESYGEDEWDYAAAEDASYESDDESWTDDGWEDESAWEEGSEESVSEEEGMFAEDEGLGFPDQVQEHILAELSIQRATGADMMVLRGEAFVLDQKKMVGKNNQTVIYTSDEDSIFHPSMDVLYLAKDSTVTIKKPKRGTFASVPFTSSFHEFFLYFETIIWEVGKEELRFTAFVDRENKVSAIESFDYFTKSRFDQFKNILKFNPIGAIYRYQTLNPDKAIFPGEILAEYRLKDQQTAFERALPGLEGSGFITYDKKTMEITPLPKLTKWAKAARAKKDFDAIQIISKVDTGAHAIMHFDNKEIEMRGVPYFSLSDSVFLRVAPLDGIVKVQKHRNLQFGGTMASGRLNFYSSNEDRPSFSFDYESYKIHCDSIDSIRFVVVRNPPPGYEPTPLEKALNNTVFEGVTGAIHIDDPNNKSGKKNYAHFPVFDSYSKSYLYWEKPNIEDGIYTKEKMNFSVDPFVLDSLEEFEWTNLHFDGEFNSSEIFPTFRQSLEVMEDFTLGFKAETPPGGYRIYDGNGKFNNEIILDGKGLRGNGDIEYLGTIAKSDSFVFHFDSVMAEVHYFNLRRGYRGGVYFPHVEANSALYKWYTKDSALSVTSTEYENLSIFNGEAEFSGTLSISEEGMVGTGEITLGQVKVIGDSIVFNEMDFYGKNTEFVIVDEEDPDQIHFRAIDVSVEYDVWRHSSTFESKEVGAQLAEFPKHQYGTTLAKGEYKRSTHDLKLEGISSYLKDNYFVSTDPKQDSLNFTGKDAYYDLEKEEIVVSGVPYIYVADATITPDEKEVVIKSDGLIRTLENATIEADQETKMHRIYDAQVDIYSRNEYEGGGKYDYIEINGKEQFIEFNNIKVNSDLTTIASGIIQEPSGFYLTDRIYFKGNTQLDASRKFLSFQGEVKIESENPVFKGAWFNFPKTIVNPDTVFIPIEENPTNGEGEVLTVGLNFVPENRVFYSNFLQTKEDDDDIEVLTASGGLTFDRAKKEFKIGSEDKLKNRVLKGATVSFNDEKNTITSQGFLKFPYDFIDRTITMKMAGSWKEDMRRRQLSTNLIMGVNMSILPEEPMKKLAETFSAITGANKDIDFNDGTFMRSISELLDEGNKGERETEKFIGNVRDAMISANGIKLAQQLPFTLLLSGVNFNYDRDYKALYSDSEVGLIGVGGNSINKVINSKIVYQFGSISVDGEKQPDKLTIYLEVDEFNYVYFHFEDEVVYTISSYYTEYNYPLQELVDKRKSEEGFRFELATEDDPPQFKQDFVKKFIR